MLRRITSLTIKEFLHIRYDWWLPVFMLVGGTMELLLIGWATSRPMTGLPLAVLDRDRSEQSRAFVRALENTGTFAIEDQADDIGAITAALDRGRINAAVIIPEDFSSEMASPTGRPVLPVLLNGAESIPATAGLQAIEGVVLATSQDLTLTRLGIDPAQFEGFDPSLRVWFNEDLSEALYTTPAELGLMLEFVVLLFAALTFAREKELGTLEQLLVMPFSSLEIIIGKSIPVLMIGFSAFIMMLSMTHVFFDVPVRGSLILLLALALFYLLVELGKGLVIAVVSRSQHQAFLIVLMVGMIDFMFTGYAAPVESMPEALQFVANFIPAHHWLTILRGILLKGVGVEILWPHILALAALGAVIGTFAIRLVRRSLT